MTYENDERIIMSQFRDGSYTLSNDERFPQNYTFIQLKPGVRSHLSKNYHHKADSESISLLCGDVPESCWVKWHNEVPPGLDIDYLEFTYRAEQEPIIRSPMPPLQGLLV